MGAADRLLLDVANRKRLGADLSDAVLGVDRVGSMETAQAFPSITVTVDDPRDRLMQSNVLVRPAVRALGTPAAFALRPIDVLLDGVWYRLRGASRSGDTVALKFNHRGAVYMAQHDTPMSASRNDETRAQFIRRQVIEAGRKRGAGHRLAFWAWEWRRRMPIAPAGEETSSRSEASRDVADSTADAGGLKGVEVRGHKLDAGQRQNAATVLRQAAEDNAPPKATLALVEACIVEAPDFANPTGGDASSVGILQLLSGHLGGSTSTHRGRRDVAYVSHLFLTEGFTGQGGAIELARKHPGATAGEIAAMVQGPRADLRGRYDAVKRDAQRVIEALGGSGGSGEGSEAGSYTKAYRFRRPRGEDGWTNTGKLADDVKRRRFVTIPVRGSDLFAYGADVDLLRLRSQATIDLEASYVIGGEEYDLDYGKTVRAMRVQVAGDPFDMDFAWGLPVTLEGGPGGKWIVYEVHEVDGSPVVELDLRMPQPAGLEPRSETVQRASTSDSDRLDDDSASGKFVERAKSISEQNLQYAWGGGHPRVGRPSMGSESSHGGHVGLGYDCSGYTSACAYAAGMWPDGLTTGQVSGWFASSWGEPGEGERITMWAHGSHVFAEVKIPGERVKWVDTSREAGGGKGPHVRYGNRSTAGFTPRHWPGV